MISTEPGGSAPSRDPLSPALLMDLLWGGLVTQTLTAAAELRVPEQLADGPRTSDRRPAAERGRTGVPPSAGDLARADVVPHRVGLPRGQRAHRRVGVPPCVRHRPVRVASRAPRGRRDRALEVLAEKVGPTGRVTGIDMDPTYVELATQLIHDRRLPNVSVAQGDARHTGLPPAVFDVVHARLVLVNIPDPEAVLAEMVRLVRPGGWVVSLEAEPLVNFVYPTDPAWDRLTEIYEAASNADGADPHRSAGPRALSPRRSDRGRTGGEGERGACRPPASHHSRGPGPGDVAKGGGLRDRGSG